MTDGEKGFTLVEVVTSLMILGVIIAVAVPVYLELKHQQTLRTQRWEAAWLLQDRMEQVQKTSSPVSTKGETREKVGRKTYQLQWKKTRLGSGLVGIQVEVTWKDEKKRKQNLTLKSVQYLPSSTVNKDSPMWSWQWSSPFWSSSFPL
ncbi:type II secretion system protein [Paludifilum halophilum]|uniref:Prepilin-type cleavage/methylation domain-containing protein n=1 Tax=Paludifilum halophilum TaxID=1642702 RepID=A0A235B642_9BACL|nr:type II secretion system protein [Paludifilum halophilum]OYD07763.1 hypothetical protein CHM34_09845 [Paludifilum halophilum]